MFPELQSDVYKRENYSWFCSEIGCALSEALEDWYRKEGLWRIFSLDC
jgi:hypothetical protein